MLGSVAFCFNWNITNLSDSINLGGLSKVVCVFYPGGMFVIVSASPTYISIFLLDFLPRKSKQMQNEIVQSRDA